MNQSISTSKFLATMATIATIVVAAIEINKEWFSNKSIEEKEQIFLRKARYFYSSGEKGLFSEMFKVLDDSVNYYGKKLSKEDVFNKRKVRNYKIYPLEEKDFHLDPNGRNVVWLDIQTDLYGKITERMWFSNRNGDYFISRVEYRKGGEQTNVISPEGVHYPEESNEIFENKLRGRIKKDNVNMREEPSIESQPIYGLNKFDELNIIRKSTSDGKDGYLKSNGRAIRILEYDKQDYLVKVKKVKTGETTLVRFEDIVIINEWVLVDKDGNTGWVCSDYIDIIDDN